MNDENNWVTKVSGRTEDILESVRNASSPDRIIRDLFRGNRSESRPAPDAALPDGYSYAAYTPANTRNAGQTPGLTVAYHAHPSDISSDFASYAILHSNGLGGTFREVILTQGEAASLQQPMPREELIALRRQEEERASSIMGIKPEYLTGGDGKSFPDGKLMEHLPELRNRIREDIRKKKPSRIILPSPWPDHPDHLAVYIAGMNAITDLQKEGYFSKNGKIEILACEPEFGVAIGQPNAVQRIPEPYGGAQPVAVSDSGAKPPLPHFPYRYALDRQTGTVRAAEDITGPEDSSVADITHYPLAVPPIIVRVDEEMAKRKIAALLQHESQVDGKNYGYLIPALDHLRGMSVGGEWGVGVYPIEIPGVTTGRSSLLESLETGSVFQLTKNILAEKTGWQEKRSGAAVAANHLGMGI